MEVSTIRQEAVYLPLILSYVSRLKTVLGYSAEQTEDQRTNLAKNVWTALLPHYCPQELFELCNPERANSASIFIEVRGWGWRDGSVLSTSCSL